MIHGAVWELSKHVTHFSWWWHDINFLQHSVEYNATCCTGKNVAAWTQTFPLHMKILWLKIQMYSAWDWFVKWSLEKISRYEERCLIVFCICNLYFYCYRHRRCFCSLVVFIFLLFSVCVLFFIFWFWLQSLTVKLGLHKSLLFGIQFLKSSFEDNLLVN